MSEQIEQKIELTLSDDQAWALAQLAKRIGWQEFRANATSDDEAYLMSDAIAKLQKALAESGYSPR